MLVQQNVHCGKSMRYKPLIERGIEPLKFIPPIHISCHARHDRELGSL